MDLTQLTHGRLLAALSLNSRYLSTSSSSLSISSVSRGCGFPCLCWSFLLLIFLSFHMLPPSSITHFTPLPGSQSLLFLLKLVFIFSLQPAFHTLIQSLSLLLSLLSLFISPSPHSLVQAILYEATTERDGCSYKSELFVHILLTGKHIQLWRKKKSSLLLHSTVKVFYTPN